MSRDPIRLVDLSDPPSPKAELLRDIIRAQQTVRPPEGKMEELAARLGPILQGGPPAPSTPWLGLAAAAVTAVALVGVTLAANTPPEANAPAVKAERLPAPPPEPEPEPVTAPDQPSPSLSAAPAENAQPENAQPKNALPENAQPKNAQPEIALPVNALPSADVRKPSASAPASAAPRCDDVMLVDAADTELRAGKPESALAAVREHERRCPTGALVQERERIAIEALVQLGRIDQARGRARAFEQRFPSSPHVGRIRQALERHSR